MNTNDLEKMSSDIKKAIEEKEKRKIEDYQKEQKAKMDIEKRKKIPVSDIIIDDKIILPIFDSLKKGIFNSLKSLSRYYPGTGSIVLFTDSGIEESKSTYTDHCYRRWQPKSNIFTELFPNERQALINQLHEMLLKEGFPYIDLILLYEKNYSSMITYHSDRGSFDDIYSFFHDAKITLFFQVILKIEKGKYDLPLKTRAKEQNSYWTTHRGLYDMEMVYNGAYSTYVRKKNIPSKAFLRFIDFRKLKYPGEWL